MQRLRVLFVDDEPGIRETMPQILEHHGFVVRTASTVNEALAEITSAQFDVLISDLNIGQPGDGFVVVSAMRRTQPNCVTIILTGYPGFETALQAIRSQVDDYLIKPASVPSLVKTIRERLEEPRSGSRVDGTKRLPQILRENTVQITQKALAAMKAHPALSQLPITDEERIENLPYILAELARIMESPETDQTNATTIRAAEARGRKRYSQGYTMTLLLTHVRLIQRAIYDVIHESLLRLNLSYLMLDLKRLNDILGVYFEHSVSGFLDAEKAGLRKGHVSQPHT